MVTHDSFVASYSKKVYYMKDGQLDLSIDRLNKTQDDYYKDIVKVTTQMHLQKTGAILFFWTKRPLKQ